MALSLAVTNTQVKALLQISVTTYDAAITTQIAEILGAVQATIDPTVLAMTDANLELLLERGITEITAGEFLNSLRRQLGYAEGVTVPGIQITSYSETGAELIKTGTERIYPYTVLGKAERDRKIAEEKAKDTLADEEITEYPARASAETLKLQNQAALIGSEKLKIDAEELKVDAETAKLTAEELKVDAETAKLTAQELKVDAETALLATKKQIADIELAQRTREEAGSADLPQGSQTADDMDFALDADIYTIGGGDSYE